MLRASTSDTLPTLTVVLVLVDSMVRVAPLPTLSNTRVPAAPPTVYTLEPSGSPT